MEHVSIFIVNSPTSVAVKITCHSDVAMETCSRFFFSRLFLYEKYFVAMRLRNRAYLSVVISIKKGLHQNITRVNMT